MAIASTSAAQLAFVEESTYGVTPNSAGKYLRMTGESLVYDLKRDTSKEINSARQVSSSTLTSASLSGGINLEFTYHEYDPFLEALLCSTFSTAFDADGYKASVTLTSCTASTRTIVGPAGTFAGLAVGDWFSMRGAGIGSGSLPATDNSGFYLISTYTDATTVVVSAATPLLEDDAGVSYAISSAKLAPGTAALRSFSIEKQFTDVSQFFMYRGLIPSKLDLSFDTGNFVTGSLSFIGADSVRAGTTGITTPAVSQSFGLMSSVAGIGHILVDGSTALLGTFVKSMRVSIDGVLRGVSAIGALGNVAVTKGTFAIGGSLEVYMTDGDVYDKAISDAYVSIAFPVYDDAKNGYVFVFSHCKLSVPKVMAGSKDSEVMLSVDFTAEAPGTNDKAVTIYRCGSAAA